MFEGKKTKVGGTTLIMAGCVYIGGLYDAILYDVGTGLGMMGFGLVCIGIHNRISRGLFNMHDGKIQYGSVRMQPPSVMGGD